MTVSVSLRPVAPQREDDLTLRTLINRIYQERGHMRNVTQESLRAEIEAEETEAEDDQLSDDVQNIEEDAGDPEARLKTLFAAKEEMVNLVG